MIRTDPYSVAHGTRSFHVAVRLGAAFFILVQAGCSSENVVEPAVATSLAAISSTTLSAIAGTAVPPPSVIIKDQRGAGMGGVTVTFAVGSGGGSVTGVSATTNSAGIAAVGGWTLGATLGPNTLVASATGLPSVTFTATGTIDPFPCSAAPVIQTLGMTTNGALTSGDCLSDGAFVDSYSITLNGVDAYLFRQSGTFDTYLFLARPTGIGILSGNLIADNDDESSATTNSAIKALLPAGSYVLGATSWEWGATGDYSLSSGTTSPEVSGCEEVYTVRGVSTTQNIRATDCLRTDGPVYADQFFIYVKASQPLTLSMSSTTVDSFLELYSVDPATRVRTLVASNDNADTSGSGDARLVYTAAADRYYAILARTGLNGQTGGYTLGIQ